MFLLIPLLAQKKEEKEQIKETIEANNKKLESFFENSIVDSIADYFSPNCKMAMEFDEMVESREDVAKYLKNDFLKTRQIKSFKLEPEETKIYDDIVMEIGSNHFEYTRPPETKVYTTTFNYIFIWKKAKDDRYRLRAALWNSSKFPCK
jgi:hypothetical protein